MNNEKHKNNAEEPHFPFLWFSPISAYGCMQKVVGHPLLRQKLTLLLISIKLVNIPCVTVKQRARLCL